MNICRHCQAAGLTGRVRNKAEGKVQETSIWSKSQGTRAAHQSLSGWGGNSNKSRALGISQWIWNILHFSNNFYGWQKVKHLGISSSWKVPHNSLKKTPETAVAVRCLPKFGSSEDFPRKVAAVQINSSPQTVHLYHSTPSSPCPILGQFYSVPCGHRGEEQLLFLNAMC